MKKILSLCLVLACVLSMGVFSTFAQQPAATGADTVTVQPRANLADVISYQEYLTDSNGNSALVVERYRVITYVHGYEVSLIQPANITSMGDLLNGATRKSYTYSYRTW